MATPENANGIENMIINAFAAIQIAKPLQDRPDKATTMRKAMSPKASI